MNVIITSADRSPLPTPLPTPERNRLRTETSATSGWAARLAALFPQSTVEPQRVTPKN